jgi:hypothetical protein
MNQTAQKAHDDQTAANVRHERRQPGERAASEERSEQQLDYESYDDAENVRMVVTRIVDQTRARIREQPLTAAAAAFIVGFAFGNGVPKFLARAGIAIGMRLVLERMLERTDLVDVVD